LLGALRGQGVPAPELIAACTDETVLGGAVFYLMEPVDGFNASVTLPELHASSPQIRHQMGLEAVSGIAALGALDYQALGLDGYGNPDGFLERQVPRWLKELDSFSKHEGYPGPDIPGLQSVADWLEQHRPSRWKPGIMHGDFHLANMMFRKDGPELAAIVDWEMSTIGDPLLDLGWLLATWPSDGDDASLGGALVQAGGLPTPEELVAHYAERTDRDLSAIHWYTVLACFKLGIILEGTHARAFAGKAPVAVGDYLHGLTLQLFRRAGAITG
jgi:aminoglycoside phosphotransferase (APT) family kinase protein